MFDSEEYESVLFVARECYVYAIPNRTSSEGHKAANWGDMGEPLWKGRIRVIETGSGVPSKASIRLEDCNTGALFATSPYEPSKANPNGGVEAVLDSSRYFVLTVVDPTRGSKAYLGMGFPERTESFDFNVALQDWSKRQTPSLSSSTSSDSDVLNLSKGASKSVTRDFSLKPGETFSVKLGATGSATSARKKATESTGGLPFLLPPPPPPARRS